MRPDVQCQIIPFSAFFVAVRTLVVSGIRVNDHVRIVRPFGFERFTAQQAPVRPMVVVNRVDVHVQLGFLCESFVADVANEPFVVFRLMDTKLLFGVARKITTRTMHSLLGRVRQQVVHGGRLVLVHVTAHVTREPHLSRVYGMGGKLALIRMFLLQVVFELVDGREADTAKVTLIHLVLGVPLLEVPQQVVPGLEYSRAHLAHGLRLLFVGLFLGAVYIQLAYFQVGRITALAFVLIIIMVAAVVTFFFQETFRGPM